jgi:transmembrane sensor
MDKKPEVTAALIEKYHLGLATPEESEAIKLWLNDSSMELEPSPLSLQIRKEKKLAIWTGITRKNNIHQLPPKNFKPDRFPIAAVLVSAGICLIFAFSYFIISRTGKVESAIQYRMLTGENGKKSIITLADGTKIHLNAGSTLNYPSHFTGKERIVKLNGEAYFEVAKNKIKPFIIHTKQGKVRVLGTQFNLKAFQNDLTESLSVVEGSVKYSDAADSANYVILSPEQHATLNDPNNSFNVRRSKPDDVAWLQNKLVFNDLPVTEITKQLERWYGIKITLKNSKLENQRYTGTYTNPSLSMLLKQLGYVMGFRYTIKNQKEVTIY